MTFSSTLRHWFTAFVYDQPAYRRIRLWVHLVFWTIELFLQFWIYKDLHPGHKPGYLWAEGLKHVFSNAFVFYGLLWWWHYPWRRHRWVALVMLVVVALLNAVVVTYVHDYFILKYELIPSNRAYWQLMADRFSLGFKDFLIAQWNQGLILSQFVFIESLCFVIKLSKEAIKYGNRSLLLEQENLKILKAHTDLELSFLKAQINPHFFFNTLNSLYSLSLKKSDQAPDLILQLSDLMRYALYSTNVPWVSLERELQFIEDYLSIEKIRLGNRVQIDYQVEGSVEALQIPPLLLIVFIENAFKHGIKNELYQGWIRLKLWVENESFTFEIENSKPDDSKLRKDVQAEPNGGIGLANARRRLSLLYPNQFDIFIDDTPTRYRLVLQIMPKQSE